MRPAEVASIVTEPTRAPVIVLVATPATAVSVPVPVTVPVPDALVKATTVVLSEVTVLPAASLIVAVSTRVAPEVRLVVAPVRVMSAAAPWTTVKAPSVPVVRPAEVASIVTEPTSGAGDGLRGDAGDGGVRTCAADGACTRGLGESNHGRVVAGDGVAGCVLDRRGQHPCRAGGQVRGRAGERDVGCGAVDDGEGAEAAGRQAGGGGFHRDRADEGAGDGLGGDAAGGGRVAAAGDRARTRGLGERDRRWCCRW